MNNRPCTTPHRAHGTKHENTAPRQLERVPSAELLARLRDLVRRDRGLTVELLAHLGEVEARRLHLEAACPSMFRYCTDILSMSGAQSYKRIGAARLARRYPQVLSMVKGGAVHLSTLCLLAPHLEGGSADELLHAAAGKSKRQVEQLLAARFPKPAAPDRLRKLPRRAQPQGSGGAGHEAVTATHGAGRSPAEAAPPRTERSRQSDTPARRDRAAEPKLPQPALALTHPPRRSSVAPISAQQYKVELTASARLVDKIRSAQELLRHQVPDGDLATVLERALDTLLPALRKQRFAEVARPPEARQASDDDDEKTRTSTPGGTTPAARAGGQPALASSPELRSSPRRPDRGAPRVSAQDHPRTTARGRPRGDRSRHIPAAVKRQVSRRDRYRCTFTDGTGRRCPEKGMLEFHHVVPFGKGGRHDADNITLRCRGHNHLASVQEYGARASLFTKKRHREAGAQLPPGGAPIRAPQAITFEDP